MTSGGLGTGWGVEFTARGEYVELSFTDIEIRSCTDVDHWIEELKLIFEHCPPMVDVLFDFRGISVDPRCGIHCVARLIELLDQYAASVAYFGLQSATASVIEPRLRARSVDGSGHRSRAPALVGLKRAHEIHEASGAPLVGYQRAIRPPSLPWQELWEESGMIML